MPIARRAKWIRDPGELEIRIFSKPPSRLERHKRRAPEAKARLKKRKKENMLEEREIAAGPERWVCPKCDRKVYMYAPTCYKCSTKKPENPEIYLVESCDPLDDEQRANMEARLAEAAETAKKRRKRRGAGKKKSKREKEADGEEAEPAAAEQPSQRRWTDEEWARYRRYRDTTNAWQSEARQPGKY